jgi:hypothetical protein
MKKRMLKEMLAPDHAIATFISLSKKGRVMSLIM